MRVQNCLFFCLIVLGSYGTVNGQEVPEWLRRAASQTMPAYASEVPAVVLLDEERSTINSDGVTTSHKTFAIRVLKKDGRSLTVAREVYLTGSTRVRELRAWLLRRSGEVLKYSNKDIIDVAAVEEDVYNEVRTKVISAVNDADAGDVFGFESISEDKTIFLQTERAFQGRLPVISSRFSLTLPAGWRAESFTFNHARIDPVVSGNSLTWEVGSLPFIKNEPSSPEVSAIVPRLAVSVFPSADKAPLHIPTFGDWRSVSIFVSGLHVSQMDASPALLEKVRDLTRNASDEIGRIRAIARYVQDIKYISIQTGVGRGGGYRPHSATDVFSKGYGDCKDKANLMRTMLKALGIIAFPVVTYSLDRTYVREEWPSPQQFNHCIIAIKVTDKIQAPALINHPQLGTLLLFDPTDPHTPVGYLPPDQQNALALVVADQDGSLVRTPASPADVGLERRIDATLGETGSIKINMNEVATGDSAVAMQRELASLSRQNYSKRIESWVAGTVTGAQMIRIEPGGGNDSEKFVLDVEFSAPQYARNPQQRLLLFNPVYVARSMHSEMTEETRRYPIMLERQSYNETSRTRFPSDYRVDELPEKVRLDEEFGSYNASYELMDGVLVFKRSLRLRTVTLPVASYATVKNFFRRIRETEESVVVLSRK